MGLARVLLPLLFIASILGEVEPIKIGNIFNAIDNAANTPLDFVKDIVGVDSDEDNGQQYQPVIEEEEEMEEEEFEEPEESAVGPILIGLVVVAGIIGLGVLVCCMFRLRCCCIMGDKVFDQIRALFRPRRKTSFTVNNTHKTTNPLSISESARSTYRWHESCLPSRETGHRYRGRERAQATGGPRKGSFIFYTRLFSQNSFSE